MWHQLTEPARDSDVEAVVSLARHAEPRCGATVVVAIDGPSGSGKTTLAKGVADALERLGTVEVVHMDLIFPGWDGLAEAPGLLTTQVLEPIAQGHPAAYRTWSWVRDEWHGTRDGRRVALPRRRGLRQQRRARRGVCRGARLRRGRAGRCG